MAYRFLKRESLPDGVRRIAAEEIDAVLEAVGASKSAQPDAEAVHTARKALKKLRALLRLLREQIGEEVFLRETACCRDAGRLLSMTRDADVRLAIFDSLADVDSSVEGSAMIREMLLNDVRAARRGGFTEKKRTAINRAMKNARVRMRLLESEEGWKVLKPGLRRSFRRACKNFEITFATEPKVETLHTCRKRVKDLYYQLGLVGGAFGPELKKIEQMAKKLGDLLGDERDLGLLCENLKNRQGIPSEALGDVCEKIARHQNRIQKKAARLGARMIEAMSGAFPKVMGRCWKKWRAAGVGARSLAAR
ncbi:MAG: hypothetical protein JWL90_4726 [Chthoniobacteraceae bacterium]|nr:hypothetical protein [Chthoniobacteraceae bacterium]